MDVYTYTHTQWRIHTYMDIWICGSILSRCHLFPTSSISSVKILGSYFMDKDPLVLNFL